MDVALLSLQYQKYAFLHLHLRIQVTGGQRSVRIAPPSCLLITAVQQPGISNPPSRFKHSSMGIIWMCKVLLCQQLLSSVMVQWIGWWFSHTCSATATSPSSPSHRHSSVPSVLSSVSIWYLQCRPGYSYMIYDIPH